MRISKVARVGLVLLATGVIIQISAYVWDKTRTTTAIDVPINVTPGHLRTPEFTVNIEAQYMVVIAAERDAMPFTTLTCLLGTDMFLDGESAEKRCTNTPSVVHAEWALSSGGKTIERGSSTGPGGSAGEKRTFGRSIGTFVGQPNCSYVLDIDFLSDLGPLNSAHPSLQVDRFPWTEENNAVGAFYGALLLDIAGIVCLIMSAVTRLRRNPTQSHLQD